MKPKALLRLIISLLLLNGLVGFSQEKHANKIVTTLDLGGNGGGYSLNVEYELFAKELFSLNTRLGIGYFPVKETHFLAIPFGLNLLAGKGNYHFEGGVGLSYIQGLTFRTIQLGDSETYYADEALYFVPSMGIRYDKLKNGLIFKLYYSPLIKIQDFLNEEQFIEDVAQDVSTFGEASKKDWFDYFFGDEFLPKATSKLGYFGITIGYRL